jgi:glutaminyl-peptide cyclotransferase
MIVNEVEMMGRCGEGHRAAKRLLLVLFALLLAAPTVRAQHATGAPHFSGQTAYALTAQLLQVAPKRFNGSPGHLKAEEFIKQHFAAEVAKGDFETDTFMATTPAGLQTMHNFIVKYPGKKDGVIVLASHYETNYPLRDIEFYGANDGAATTALLIEMGNVLRAHPPEGYSVWLVFDDGEEAVKDWFQGNDHLYGTRHLAAKWSQEGILGKIKAFIVADMCADKDLNIDYVDSSTPWLSDTLKVAAKDTGYSAYIFKYHQDEQDDHLPFLERGVPVLDFIDSHYGPVTNATPDGYHHTAQDTLDKISARSLQISGSLLLEMIHLINQRP